MARSRAADDFAGIRARMEELRRERERERVQASDEDEIGPIAGARRRISGSPAKAAEAALQRALARVLPR
jgi:hypothetical protein